MSRKLTLKRVHAFGALIEFVPGFSELYDKQGQFAETFVEKGKALALKEGYGRLQAPSISAMDSKDDFIAVVFKDDRFHLRVDIHSGQVAVFREGLSLENQEEAGRILQFAEVMARAAVASLSATFFRDRCEESGLGPAADRIYDYIHRWESIVALRGNAKNYQLMLPFLCATRDGRESPFNVFGLDSRGDEAESSPFYRCDLKVSFPSRDRNLWVDLQAPHNDENSLVWLQFSVKPDDRSSSAPPDQLAKDSLDFRNSWKLHSELFQDFAKRFLEGVEFEHKVT